MYGELQVSSAPAAPTPPNDTTAITAITPHSTRRRVMADPPGRKILLLRLTPAAGTPALDKPPRETLTSAHVVSRLAQWSASRWLRPAGSPQRGWPSPHGPRAFHRRREPPGAGVRGDGALAPGSRASRANRRRPRGEAARRHRRAHRGGRAGRWPAADPAPSGPDQPSRSSAEEPRRLRLLPGAASAAARGPGALRGRGGRDGDRPDAGGGARRGRGRPWR